MSDDDQKGEGEQWPLSPKCPRCGRLAEQALYQLEKGVCGRMWVCYWCGKNTPPELSWDDSAKYWMEGEIDGV